MKTIKFRGYYEGSWVYGSCLNGNVIRVYKDFDYTDYLVLPQSIGQFTGVTDKNGNDIYEGDILVWEDEFGVNPRVTIVQYDETSASFRLFNNAGVKTRAVLDAHSCKNYRTIVGNIIDNPELLNGGDKHD